MADDKTTDDEKVSPYYLFVLTNLIGKVATQGRTTVIMGSEIRLVTAIWFFTSLGATIILAIILGFAAIGPYAIFLPLLIPLIVTYFATTRSRAGLHLTHMRRTMDLLDRPWAKGLLVYAGRLYDPTVVRLITLTPATVDVAALPDYEPPEDTTMFESVAATVRPEAPVLARTTDNTPVRSARGAAARVADVRTAMMDVGYEEERVQWARNWEAGQRRKREQLLIDIGAIPDPNAQSDADTVADADAAGEDAPRENAEVAA